MANRRRDVGQELFWNGKQPTQPQPTPAFVSARITGKPRRERTLALEFSGGRVLRLPESIPVERLVEALEASAPR